MSQLANRMAQTSQSVQCMRRRTVRSLACFVGMSWRAERSDSQMIQWVPGRGKISGGGGGWTPPVGNKRREHLDTLVKKAGVGWSSFDTPSTGYLIFYPD